MSQTPAVPAYVSSAMKFILRSPLHGMVSKTVLLISFTGRKSGKTYTTPVDYSTHGDEVHIFTHANWWKNLDGGAPVTLRLRGQEVSGQAQAVAQDKQAVAAALAAHLRKVPSDARYYKVSFDEHKSPNPAEVAQAAKTVVWVRVKPC